jgi:hypothetical protein
MADLIRSLWTSPEAMLVTEFHKTGKDTFKKSCWKSSMLATYFDCFHLDPDPKDSSKGSHLKINQ